MWVKISVKMALYLTVSEILTFFFFYAKIQDGRQKWRKLKFFYYPTTLWVKNFVQIALSLTVSEMLRFFLFRKNSRWPPKVAKIEFFQFHIEYSATTLRVKISVKMALSLTVSEILTFFFVFPQKFKMAAKSGENWNFSIAHRILYHYHASQNFCQNGSISYGFRDINIFFCFSAKIQDGRQKWRKLKFFNFV